MSRINHPLDRMVAPFKAEATTARDCNSAHCSMSWRVTLSNNEGDKFTRSGTFPRLPKGNQEWHEFWLGVNAQLSWEKQLLTAAPIARQLSSHIALEIVQFRLDNSLWLDGLFLLRNVLGSTLYDTMRKLTTLEFAAVQHLCKKRLMQIP